MMSQDFRDFKMPLNWLRSFPVFENFLSILILILFNVTIQKKDFSGILHSIRIHFAHISVTLNALAFHLENFRFYTHLKQVRGCSRVNWPTGAWRLAPPTFTTPRTRKNNPPLATSPLL